MPLDKNSMFFGFADKLTEEQKVYVDNILDKKVIFCSARSGSGKTTLAVACAKLLGKDLVYVFSAVEEKTLGFRPGTTKTKEKDYITPLLDALYEINENPSQVIFDEDNIDNLKNGNVWVYPMSHTFARGTNLKNKTVIIDESQNFTRGELKKILSRIHDDCTVIVIGDPNQCDLKDKKEKSGFIPYLEHFNGESYVAVCELTRNFRGVISAKSESLTW